MEKLKQYVDNGILQLAKLDDNNKPRNVPFSQIQSQVTRTEKNANVYKLISQLTWDEKYEWVNLKRLKAKQKYQQGQYDQAIQIYIESLCGIDLNQNTDNRLQQMKNDLQYPISLNIATCLYMKKQYKKAIVLCDKILVENSQYLPALYKKVYLLIKNGDIAESKQFLSKGIKIAKQKNNEKYLKDFMLLNGQISKASKQGKNVYMKMFQQNNQQDTSSTRESQSNQSSGLLSRSNSSKSQNPQEQILYQEQQSICKKLAICFKTCLYTVFPWTKPRKRLLRQKSI